MHLHLYLCWSLYITFIQLSIETFDEYIVDIIKIRHISLPSLFVAEAVCTQRKNRRKRTVKQKVVWFFACFLIEENLLNSGVFSPMLCAYPRVFPVYFDSDLSPIECKPDAPAPSTNPNSQSWGKFANLMFNPILITLLLQISSCTFYYYLCFHNLLGINISTFVRFFLFSTTITVIFNSFDYLRKSSQKYPFSCCCLE